MPGRITPVTAGMSHSAAEMPVGKIHAVRLLRKNSTTSTSFTSPPLSAETLSSSCPSHQQIPERLLARKNSRVCHEHAYIRTKFAKIRRKNFCVTELKITWIGWSTQIFTRDSVLIEHTENRHLNERSSKTEFAFQSTGPCCCDRG